MPAWLVLLAVSSLALSLTYQLAVRRFGWRVLIYWAVILLGILAAEGLVEYLGWNGTRLGDVRLGADVAGAVLTLGMLRALRL
jgi:hypothetical protein